MLGICHGQRWLHINHAIPNVGYLLTARCTNAARVTTLVHTLILLLISGQSKWNWHSYLLWTLVDLLWRRHGHTWACPECPDHNVNWANPSQQRVHLGQAEIAQACMYCRYFSRWWGGNPGQEGVRGEIKAPPSRPPGRGCDMGQWPGCRTCIGAIAGCAALRLGKPG